MAEIAAYHMLVDGKPVDASDGRCFDSVNPATGEVWCRVPEATDLDVDQAVAAAVRSFESGPWAQMAPSQRGRLLRRLGDLLAERSSELTTARTPRGLKVH